MSNRLTPPLKYHGGKSYLAERIIALFPPHTHYVEPYCGGCAVLLARDPEGVSEVVNGGIGPEGELLCVDRDVADALILQAIEDL